MTTDHDTPPQPGLTREPTGYASGVFIGWNYTPAYQRDMARRTARRHHEGMSVDELEDARDRLRTRQRGRKGPVRVGRKVS